MTKARNISKGQAVTQETATASTSGTEIDYDVPAGTIRITVMFDETSLTAGNPILVRLGTSGGIQATGYTSRSQTTGSGTTSTGAFVMRFTGAGDLMMGSMTIVNITDNIWVSSHIAYRSTSNEIIRGAGRVSLSDEITQLRITRNSSGTFDNGYVNVLFG